MLKEEIKNNQLKREKSDPSQFKLTYQSHDLDHETRITKKKAN
jgi:hypothetical protein